MLTQEQLKQNITAMEQQGAKPVEIQSYLDSLKGTNQQAGTSSNTTRPVVRQGIEMKDRPLFQRIEDKAGGVAEGVAQSVLGTVHGAGTLVEQGLQKAFVPALSKITGVPQDQIKGSEFFTPGTEQFEKVQEIITPTTPEQKAGSFVGDVAQFAVPGSQVTKLTKAAPILSKILARGATSAGVASAQSGEIGKESATAFITEAAFPVAGAVLKPVAKITGRLLKGLGSSLSGAGVSEIDQILTNPQKASEIAKQIDKTGGFTVLKQNAEDIVAGVRKIKSEARAAFSKGLDTLSQADIDSNILKQGGLETINDYGLAIKNGKVSFGVGSEITGKVNQKRAEMAIEFLNNAENLDGKSVRSVMKQIDDLKWKSAGTDSQKQALNSFLTDFSSKIRQSISQSTNKLDDINKLFSQEMQIAEVIEQEFGKVKFANLPELVKTSKKLETLFNKKGIAPEIIDDFLNKAGIGAEDFKTTEAVRQITNKIQKANTKGLSITEIMQNITSSVVTPGTVRDISILTGKSIQRIEPVLQVLDPVGRAAFLEFLLSESE